MPMLGQGALQLLLLSAGARFPSGCRAFEKKRAQGGAEWGSSESRLLGANSGWPAGTPAPSAPSQDAPVCWICLDSTGPLIFPCKCPRCAQQGCRRRGGATGTSGRLSCLQSAAL